MKVKSIYYDIRRHIKSHDSIFLKSFNTFESSKTYLKVKFENTSFTKTNVEDFPVSRLEKVKFLIQSGQLQN